MSARRLDPKAETYTAPVWLNGPGVQRRLLMHFERYVEVRWPANVGKVVLVERTIHYAAIHAFTLGARETGPPDRIQQDIVRAMSTRLPRLGSVQNRWIAFGREGVACVLVAESGLPRGRTQGSFDERRASFVIDLRRMRAIPAPRCPGAHL